ncbi:serine/threonine-protein kinase/endoribonuclease IRE1b-like [Salvia hispanica]|uniref:serine/threonine-protein kinase/endoribonuclease IRE1b-like n=1 Tax=Salvia hispanica TaxID=49212 RepID=UPI0020091094|nr:serine/threonine-protein kinase/endoribonuclease IRE1b-like [Salvia hispanica]
MRGLLIPLFFVILILAVVVRASSSSDPDPDSDNPPLPLTAKHETAILAAPDGTVYLVEIGSGKILWSFSSGPSIYSSYQQIPNHEGEKLNTSSDGDNFYIDCGEDWELYLHGTGLKKVKLPMSAEEFVKRTPFVSAGGGIMLGSKKTSVFVVDAKTGKVVRTLRSDNLSSGEDRGADETSIMTRADIEKWLPASSVDAEAVEKPLYLTRTDYAVKYTSAKTGEVLWYLMFADIEASFQCEGIEDFLGGFSGRGIDMKLPMPCQTRPLVYRIRDLANTLKFQHLLEALENTGKAALDGKWDERMEPAFINDIGRFRRYRYDSVRDLLRVIRNKLNHYRELPREIQSILGSVPEGFNTYFSTRFPKLLIEVYHVIRCHCENEETFGKYFRGSGF